MSDYERLSVALGKLHAQGIATVLDLHGTTGVIEDCLKDYQRAAAKMGTTDWVGTHVGAYEHGGACWDERETLRDRFDNSPVTTLWFSFNHRRPELAELLTEAVQAEGLSVGPRERDTDCVTVRLGGDR